MQICTVIGHVWSTKKEPSLEGLKFMVVREKEAPGGVPFVAADLVGAGEGEEVLVVAGSTARYAVKNNDAPIDAAIVGIIDTYETEKAGRR